MNDNLYQILGISQSATNEQIKSTYKKLAKQYHPDKNKGSLWHEEQFKKIAYAYSILSDTEKRRKYDYTLNRPIIVTSRNTQNKSTSYNNNNYEEIDPLIYEKYKAHIQKERKNYFLHSLKLFIIIVFVLSSAIFSEVQYKAHIKKQYYDKALSYFNNNNTNLALALVLIALNKDNNNTEYYNLLKKIKNKISENNYNDYNSKKTLINDKLKYHLLLKAYNYNPNPIYIFQLIELSFLHKNYKACANYCYQYNKLTPPIDLYSKSLIYSYHSNKNTLNYLNALLAIEEYATVTNCNKDSIAYYYADLEQKQKYFKLAIKHYNQHLLYANANEDTYNKLAQCYFNISEIDSANYYLDKSIKENKNKASSYYLKAEIHMYLNDNYNACLYFTKAIAEDSVNYYHDKNVFCK